MTLRTVFFAAEARACAGFASALPAAVRRHASRACWRIFLPLPSLSLLSSRIRPTGHRPNKNMAPIMIHELRSLLLFFFGGRGCKPLFSSYS